MLQGRAESVGFPTMRVGEPTASLERIGQRIGDLDLLIAGHALAVGQVLVTNNLRAFRRVPGLSVEDWSLSDSP